MFFCRDFLKLLPGPHNPRPSIAFKLFVFADKWFANNASRALFGINRVEKPFQVFVSVIDHRASDSILHVQAGASQIENGRGMINPNGGAR